MPQEIPAAVISVAELIRRLEQVSYPDHKFIHVVHHGRKNERTFNRLALTAYEGANGNDFLIISEEPRDG